MNQYVDSQLLSDLAEIWIEEMRRFGVKVRRHPDPVRTGVEYHSTLRKLVWPAPRRIEKAREFICPPPQAGALARLEAEITRGDKLTRRLSRRALKANFKDGLLNHWRIHHVHLSQRRSRKQADHLLFARFEPEVAYLLAIMPHKDIGGAPNFDEPRIYRILEDNWPQLLGARLVGITSSSATVHVDKRAIAELRRAGINRLMPAACGSVRLEPGGVTTSCHSSEAAEAALNAAHLCREIERHVVAELDRLTREGHIAPPRQCLTLRLKKVGWSCYG
jgi:hypothetical protein